MTVEEMVQNVSIGKKVLSPYNPPKMGFENLGGMALFWFAFLGGWYPIHPVLITPWGPLFKWGKSPSIWGRYGSLKFLEI